MLGLSIAVAAACILVVFVGATVQASVGVGMGMLSSPVLALADHDFIPAAIVLSVVPLTASIAWVEREHIDRRDLVLTLGGRLPGVVCGAFVAAAFADDVLAVLVAASVLLAVIISLSRATFTPRDSTLVAAGLASGFMGTATGVGGPPMALAYQHSDPQKMRGTLSAFFAVGALMSIVALSLAGEIGTRQLQLSAMLLPSVVVGVITARLMRHRLNEAIVRPAILFVCAASAIALLIKTFT